ncbi:MAG: hypothetical protein GC184_09650 [Rhizobiales bacterium]|nr:hypothetical protein [Hyphomicrobiales bacterium]
MIVVTGTVEVGEGSRDQAMALAVEVAQATRQEPGCISYGFYVDIENPQCFRIYEEWESEEALTRHFTMPHMVRFAEGMSDIDVSAMDISKFEAGERSPI